MIDHLLSFSDEAAALAALADTSFVVDGGEVPAFDLSRCFPGLTLIVTPATFDEEGALLTPAVHFPGWWMVIATDGPGPDPALTTLEACRMVAHRALAAAGWPFIFAEGLRAAPEEIASVVRIDGLPAGSAYPFHAPSLIVP